MWGDFFFVGNDGHDVRGLQAVRDRLEHYKWLKEVYNQVLFLEHLRVLHGCDTLKRFEIFHANNTSQEADAIATVIVSCKNLKEFALRTGILNLVLHDSIVHALVANKSVKSIDVNGYIMNSSCAHLICGRSDWLDLRLTTNCDLGHIDTMLSKSQVIRKLTLHTIFDHKQMIFHNLSLRTVWINGENRNDIKQRNARVLQNVIDSVVQILLIGKYAWRFWVPYDIVRQIAQYVWSTRFDPDVWLFKK